MSELSKVSPKMRDCAVVAAFTCLLFLPFMGKAYHVDEPFFLAGARQILRDPFHPLAFDFNWYGSAVPMSQINNTPPFIFYALAAALKATGGNEFFTRLLFLPFDLLAALSLYLLARKFLSRPLLPVLIAIASPAYMINMNHLCTEKIIAAFGFSGIYVLVEAVESRRGAWYWGSAALLGMAILSKYNAVFFLLPAVGYGLERGLPWRRVAAHGALVLAPLACLLLYDFLNHPMIAQAIWAVTAQAADSWWSGWAHKLRSFLAFCGGCGVVTLVWLYRGWPRKAWLLASAASLLLFLPAFDTPFSARGIDRFLGIILSLGALLALARLASAPARRLRGWPLWAPWVLSVALVQLCVYWSVMARLIVFLTVPLALALAEFLESQGKPEKLARFYGISLLGTLMISLSLAGVDFRYAQAQKTFAHDIAARYLGKKIWFTGHWGFQYYLEESGARALDAGRGGWDQAKPGDVVVASVVNANVLRPNRPMRSNLFTARVEHPTPLRLMSGWTGQGGFYSNVWGFLPYAVSREPLEEFRILELL